MLTIRTWLLRVFIGVAACGALLAPTDAHAGTVQVKDTDALLSAADVAALRGEGEALPFDVRVVTTGEHPDKADLDRFVHEQLASPNMVVVGLDKAHRHTAVHFGTATGVPASEFRAIEQAGNTSFREGNWREGISAILRETRAAARPGASSSAATGSIPPQRTTGSAGASTAMWGLLAVLAVAGLIVFVGVTLARRARNGMLGSAPGALPPGVLPPPPPGGPAGQGYPPGQGYGPGYGYPPGGYGGGGGGIGRNIAAAGLGGFLGYELGKMAGEHGDAHAHEGEQSAAIGSQPHDNDVASPDAGGAAGGWDDDSSSDTGSDWGGGDTGGGGDWGGEDSGGGSDW